MKKTAKRTEPLTAELLEANGYKWEYPADHCNYRWYSKKGSEVSLKYSTHYKEFTYKRIVKTVGDLKDIAKVVYGEKIKIYLT